MIRICKNFPPTGKSKRSSININNNKLSNSVLKTLHKLEIFQNNPINKEFNPDSYNLCEELIEIVRDKVLKVNPSVHNYLTEKVRNVKY